MTASSEAAINDFDTSVSRIVVVLPPLKNTNTSLVYVFVCDRVCKLLVRLNLNNRKLLRDEKRLFSGCYRPVGVSYVSRMWQVSLSCPPKSYNQSSFFFKNQYLCTRFRKNDSARVDFSHFMCIKKTQSRVPSLSMEFAFFIYCLFKANFSTKEINMLTRQSLQTIYQRKTQILQTI